MHFRTRKNVIQFIRTSYDENTKAAKSMVVGRIPLAEPEIDDELRAKLTDSELAEAQVWIEGQGRVARLREELAALTLAETLEAATSWFAKQGDSAVASMAVAKILPQMQALRKTLKKNGLL